MNDVTVDVVIVGAGPAGSVAAWKLSEKGVKVLVIDKKQELGTPKRCAEGLSLNGMEKVGLKPDPLWAPNKIIKTTLYTASMREVLIAPKDTMGFVLERKIFEKHLARKAIESGAKYMVKTHALDIIKDGEQIRGVIAEHMGETFKINAKLVIAADGVDSLMAKKAGLDTLNHLKDYHSGFQYEMVNVNCEHESLHIFFGVDKAPGGYLWFFPKGNNIVNVGIGIVASKSQDGARAKDLLDKFIADNPRFFENASPIEMNAGGIPVSVSSRTFVGNGIMVVGDAAQQVNPIHGGGIALAINAAQMLSEVAKKALDEGDLSCERLFEYEKMWNDTDGYKMRRLAKLRSFIEKLDDKDIEKLADILGGDDVMRLVVETDLKILLKVLITKAPTMLSLAKKCLT